MPALAPLTANGLLCPQRERERKGVESELERLVQSWSARKELRQMLATLPTIWPAAAVEVFPAALTQRYAWPEPKIKKKYMAALRYAEQPTASLLAGLLIVCLRFAGTLSPQVEPLTLRLLGDGRLVHPDKLPPTVSTREEVLAAKIFTQLQEGYDAFKRAPVLMR